MTELHAAHSADVARLDVHRHVPLQRADGAERAKTLGACVRLFASVNSQVYLQVAWHREALFANAAGV